MKTYIITIGLLTCAYSTFAQNKNEHNILVRHDTTLLKANECEWIIKSLAKNYPSLTSQIGKPVPLIMLQAIEKGKLKAIDPETNKPIPPKEIFTWKIAADTMPVYNNDGNVTSYQVVKRLHSSSDLNQLRIFQDWYFDVSTGKFNSVIKWIELLEEIHSAATGTFIGYAVFCRIYY